MATKTKTAPVANLAAAAEAISKLPPKAQYKSAAAMLEAAAPGTERRVATSVRGVMRNAEKGVGRGNRYVGLTPEQWTKQYKTQQAAKQQVRDSAKAAKAKKTPAKA